MSGPGLRIVTPSRLHFGLLAWGEDHPRQFGSVGLMIDRPGIEVCARASSAWSADGPLGDRALVLARRVADALVAEGRALKPLHLAIERATREHVGLGAGTQLSLAVARLLLATAGDSQPTAERLAALTGRGRRSGIGLHGFLHGGLLVDGGRSPESKNPPLLCRLEFPGDWSILVLIAPVGHGLAGIDERHAFGRLAAVPARTVERLCRLLLLELLPAAAERDLDAFGSALSRLQEEVGRGFAPVQGGIFAHPQSEAIAEAMRRLGLVGVGQSSWGPALFGIIRRDDDRQAAIGRALRDQFSLDAEALFWTTASMTGARLSVE
jgi:beta-ribofuranosylaminobenzene 5'-phosphate synthase